LNSSLICNDDHCADNPQFISTNSESYDRSEACLDPSTDTDGDGNPCTESITYGGGFLQGNIVRESVWIESMEVENQDIAEVTAEDNESTPNFSCLIGLSFPELAPRGENLLFDNMMAQELLNENLFTTFYYADFEHADLYFGGVLDQYYTGEINYAPVQRREHWNIRIDDVLLDGVSTGMCDTDLGCQGIVDTGTNANTFESEQWNNIISPAIPDQLYECNSDNINNPTMTYVINGISYTFEPNEYAVPSGDGYCDIELFDMNVFEDPNQPSIVLGVSFLRKYFTIFDRTDDANPQIGFALGNVELTINADEYDRVDEIHDNTQDYAY
jgi:hypothetical protein